MLLIKKSILLFWIFLLVSGSETIPGFAMMKDPVEVPLEELLPAAREAIINRHKCDPKKPTKEEEKRRRIADRERMAEEASKQRLSGKLPPPPRTLTPLSRAPVAVLKDKEVLLLSPKRLDFKSTAVGSSPNDVPIVDLPTRASFIGGSLQPEQLQEVPKGVNFVVQKPAAAGLRRREVVRTLEASSQAAPASAVADQDTSPSTRTSLDFFHNSPDKIFIIKSRN